MILNDLLLDSCKEMYRLSEDCTNDFVAFNSSSTTHAASCNWYHSVWQYLRILDCVSAPQWHQSFYEEAIKSSLTTSKTPISILISGTADYSLLYLNINVLDKKIPPEQGAIIDVVDLCGTPLKICEWYINKEKANNKDILSNISVSYYKSNITLFDRGRKYHMICTDAFLTRFSSLETASIVSKWHSLLHNGGRIITTVRIHENNNAHTSLVEQIKDIRLYIDKIQNRFKNLPPEDLEKMDILIDKLSFMALRYIVRMKSNHVGNLSEIKQLFQQANLKPLVVQVASVPGEIRETSYCRLVAQRED